jgi:hypothetical protein
MRLVALILFLAVVCPAASHAARPAPSSPTRSALTEDIALSLASTGIEVAEAAENAGGSFPVGPRRAVRVALRNFGGFAYPYTSGWVRVGRVTLHLVRVVRSSSRGELGLFPDQLVWLVVIRDVTIPNLGPPHGRRGPLTYTGTMAVFVRTDVPRYILAASF